jgi:hypothetical protein
MKPNPKFLNETTPEFWANVKVISQKLGYTQKGGSKTIKVHNIEDIISLYLKLGFNTNKLIYNNEITDFGCLMVKYFEYRADALNNYVQHYLMDLEEAKELYFDLIKRYNPKVSIPQNKQSGSKRAVNYFTGIINILIEANVGNYEVKYSASELTAFTLNKVPFRSLSRRVDGSFPSVINPIALWEIKEYYHTTSFGSRVADGVYETQLDGLELNEVRRTLDRTIRHYLMIDSKFTWWGSGKSYLCRIFDMMHMGLLNEAIFGKEAVDRIPIITKEWIQDYERLKDFLDI